MRFVDCHTHTFPFSPDAHTSLEEHAASAREKGLKGFILTDHCDMVPWPDPHPETGERYFVDFRRDESYDLLLKVREQNPDLYIGFGAELGEWYYDREKGSAFAADTRLDFIIGSLHTLDGTDFAVMTYESETQCDALLERYAEHLIDHCKFSPLDVLGHLTYPLRYMHRHANLRPDFTRQRDAVAEALRALIERGKGIEINTSGLRKGFGATFPDRYWLELYRDLGGEIVTFGADAHYAKDIGADFNVAADLLRSCGFKNVFYFKNREPVAIPLD